MTAVDVLVWSRVVPRFLKGTCGWPLQLCLRRPRDPPLVWRLRVLLCVVTRNRMTVLHGLSCRKIRRLYDLMQRIRRLMLVLFFLFYDLILYSTTVILLRLK